MPVKLFGKDQGEEERRYSVTDRLFEVSDLVALLEAEERESERAA
jgi:hypothetical protein